MDSLPLSQTLLGSDLAGGSNTDLLGGFSRLRTNSFNIFYNIKTFQNFAKNNMLAVQPWGGDGGDEELGTLRVGAGVGHGQVSLFGVLDLEVLVVELATIDGLAADSGSMGKISTLRILYIPIQQNTI